MLIILFIYKQLYTTTQVLLCCGEETYCTARNASLLATKLALEADHGVHEATDAGELFQRSQLQRYAIQLLVERCAGCGDCVCCV